MKYSKQRDMILQYITSSCTHPTAEMVYKDLKEEIPNLSLGTVYRNLDRFVKENLILRIKIPNDKDRFDVNTKKHAHAICTKCGKVTDISLKQIDDLDYCIQDLFKCKVISKSLVFYTICNECDKGGI